MTEPEDGAIVHRRLGPYYLSSLILFLISAAGFTLTEDAVFEGFMLLGVAVGAIGLCIGEWEVRHD